MKDIVQRIETIRVLDVLETAKVIGQALKLLGESKTEVVCSKCTVFASLSARGVDIGYKTSFGSKVAMVETELRLVEDLEMATEAVHLLVKHHPVLRKLVAKPTTHRRYHRVWRRAAVDFLRGAEIAQQTELIGRGGTVTQTGVN